LKQTADDADKLDETYEAWQQNIAKVERNLHKEGVRTVRVSISIEALNAWCRVHNKPRNGASRSAYAAKLASERE
jgi:hypothetical protein